jgi:hypothetical protein
VEFGKDGCKVNHGGRSTKGKITYFFNVNVRQNLQTAFWHQRLGHLNMASLKELYKMVNGMNLKDVPLHHVSERCIDGEHQRTFFPKDEVTTTSKLLEIVHANVCGPMKTTFLGGTQHFVMFIDDFLKITHVYVLKAKGEVFNKFKKYKVLMENETNVKINILQSNNGEKFVSKSLMHFWVNVESNNKQVRHIHDNKMELLKGPIQ